MGQLASGTSAQPFTTVKDYTNWLSRLEQYNVWLGSADAKMRQGITEGYVLPKSLIKKIIPQFESLSEVTTDGEGIVDVSNHLFYSPIKKFPESFTEKEKATFIEKYTSILNYKLIPSFKSFGDYFLKSEYLSAGRKSSGISEIPDGEAYYNHAIKNYTTTNMTADEIHALGLSEVARILSEMKKVKKEVGFKGTIKDFFNEVRTKKGIDALQHSKRNFRSF